MSTKTSSNAPDSAFLIEALKLIAGFSLAVSAVVSSGCATGDPEASPVLAVVGLDAVTRMDLERRLLGRFSERRVLLGLIREILWNQEAERLGIRVRPDDVREAVEDQVAGQREALSLSLAEAGLTWADHVWELSQELHNQLLRERVVRAHREIGELELLDRYRQTFAGEQVELSHVSFPFEGEGGADAMMAATESRARDALKRLQDGVDFAKIASDTDGATVRNSDGSLGRVRWDRLPEAWRAALGSLNPGALSEPIRENGYGFHIFRLERRVPIRPLEEVRDLLRTELEEAPVTLEEIAFVEREIRRQLHVEVFEENLRLPGGTPVPNRSARSDRLPRGTPSS